MLPKEKAVELVLKFSKVLEYTDSDTDSVETDLFVARQCALIAVGEIMNMDVWDNRFDNISFVNIYYDLIFWKQVKEEIIKMSYRPCESLNPPL